MKMSVELVEAEIRAACAKWLAERSASANPLPGDVRLDIVKGDDDPRGPTSDTVRAIITYDV